MNGLSTTIVYIPIKRVSVEIIGGENYYNIINSLESGNFICCMGADRGRNS
jgi:hypothetical protein